MAADQPQVQCLAFNRTGSHLASGGVEGTIRVWQATANSATGLTAVSSSSSLELRGHEKELSKVGTDGGVHAHAACALLILALSRLSLLPMQLCWNPASDHQLASCGRDRAVRLWDVRHKGHETHKIMTNAQAMVR